MMKALAAAWRKQPIRILSLFFFLFAALTAHGATLSDQIQRTEHGTGMAVDAHRPQYFVFRKLLYTLVAAVVGKGRIDYSEGASWHANALPYLVKEIDVIVNLLYEKGIFFSAELMYYYWIVPISSHFDVFRRATKIFNWFFGCMAFLAISLLGTYAKVALHRKWQLWLKGLGAAVAFFGMVYLYFCTEEYADKLDMDQLPRQHVI